MKRVISISWLLSSQVNAYASAPQLVSVGGIEREHKGKGKGQGKGKGKGKGKEKV